MLCKTCRKGDLKQDDFYKKAKGKIGFQTECKVCFNLRAKKNRIKKNWINIIIG
jgi:hypothetical protein